MLKWKVKYLINKTHLWINNILKYQIIDTHLKQKADIKFYSFRVLKTKNKIKSAPYSLSTLFWGSYRVTSNKPDLRSKFCGGPIKRGRIEIQQRKSAYRSAYASRKGKRNRRGLLVSATSQLPHKKFHFHFFATAFVFSVNFLTTQLLHPHSNLKIIW